jgi:adenylosuccinate synthase
LELKERLAPLLADVSALLEQYIKDDKSVMFEGAQGMLLDIDHGTYPYVTSSNTTAAAASSGSGVGPLSMDYVLGVTKAYTTRVGGGPFPTELDDDIGRRLGDRGQEFGATTGRPRRCGWFDAVAMRRARQVNGLSGLCLTKLDVLDGLPTIKICTAYDRGNQTLTLPPSGAGAIEQCKPVYDELPGWQDSTSGARRMQDLPAAARDYIAKIEALTEVSVDLISTGADRDDTICLRHPFD